MFPVWLILGLLLVLLAIFNRQMLHVLGLKPLSEVFTSPGLTRSSRVIETIARWLVILLGMSFLVQGLGERIPADISSVLSYSLLGLAGLLILAILAITMIGRKIK